MCCRAGSARWRRYRRSASTGANTSVTPASDPTKTDCRWMDAIEGAAEFDPLFFESRRRRRSVMDPKQRLLLQESWKALEDAGYGPARLAAGSVGMFVGVEQGDYRRSRQARHAALRTTTACSPARLAYFLDLHGPVMAIDTACSSGLVAAHEACNALRSGECDTAIAGAASTCTLTPRPSLGSRQAGMLSPTGSATPSTCAPTGWCRARPSSHWCSSGCRTRSATETAIHGVIVGSGINYDGKTNGITAPNGASQARLIRSVYDRYRIDAADIGYIVTHGTGTRLGDPVEINALTDVFRERTQDTGTCALTSTKTNFGHTFAASGLVSLVSLLAAMRHETIPAVAALRAARATTSSGRRAPSSSTRSPGPGRCGRASRDSVR